MKLIQNDQLNSIRFIKSNEVTSDITNVVLRQLGSSRETIISCSINIEDCSSILLDVYLGANQLSNGLYTLNVVDSVDDVIFTATVEIENNTDTTDAYLVWDDDVSIEDTIDVPTVVISWSNNTVTFSNNNNI